MEADQSLNLRGLWATFGAIRYFPDQSVFSDLAKTASYNQIYAKTTAFK